MISSNALGQEASLYLQQHKNNPVWWQPWSEGALAAARQTDKPILLSIGYSACHWCHVMERECFEHEDVAALMNEHFVCIKLDREERPDVDMVYMAAVQAMGVRGGWPLNVFLLPDGSPFYGGTYYPKHVWLRLLSDIANAWALNRQAIQTAGDQVREGIRGEGLFKPEDEGHPNLHQAVRQLTRTFDRENGGFQGAPKFPTPVVFSFLLEYESTYQQRQVLDFANLTLRRMACGGMYDVLGGGFCRYSVDEQWFIPHFEKMLYDNGQLLSLYSEGARYLRSPFYRQIAQETVGFLKDVFLAGSGLFYSALDADSDGREGGYYTFTMDDLKGAGPGEHEAARRYLGFTDEGNWSEEQANVPVDVLTLEGNREGGFRTIPEGAQVRDKLLAIRNKRKLPGLDQKHIVCWNALTITGLCDHFTESGDKEALEMARKCATAIEKEATLDGNLLHQTGKDRPIYGFLDDHASMGLAYLKLYSATGEEEYYEKALQLAIRILGLFEPDENGLFPYVSRIGERLIVEKTDIFDSVIPSANSMLFDLVRQMAILSEDPGFQAATDKLEAYGRAITGKDIRFSANWARVLHQSEEQFLIAIAGNGWQEAGSELREAMPPVPAVVVGAEGRSIVPYLQAKLGQGKSLAIYVCKGKVCLEPFGTVEEATESIKAWGPDDLAG